MIQTPTLWGGRSCLTLAALFLVVLAPAAQASFIYSVAPVSTSTNFGAASNLTVVAANNGANSGVLSAQAVLINTIIQTSATIQPSTDLANVPLAPLVISITNQNGGGGGAFVVNGTIVVTRSDTSGFLSTFSPGSITPPSLTLGAFTYTLGSPIYVSPTRTIGTNTNGSLSYTITETTGGTVPEPSMFVLAATGVGCGLVSRIRRRRRAAA